MLNINFLWVINFIAPFSIAAYFIFIYVKDKDLRKLMFANAFWILSLNSIQSLLAYNFITYENQLLSNFFHSINSSEEGY